MYTVTFYSYKGGVGRSMALANTAHRLSAKGKKLFLLDFDLEAPGLGTFFKNQVDKPGLVEYITEYLENGTIPALDEFVSEITPTQGTRGSILCMRAGKGDDSYQERLARLNWKDFYAQNNGFLFVENLKGAILAAYAPDYVLVDSRTGLTDVSGICTLQLPSLVVFVFALNDQNLDGTAKIYKSVTENKLNRPIDTLLVASPVPDLPDYAEIKKQRYLKAKEQIGRDIDLSLPFAPFAAFEETILGPRTGTHLSEAYDELVEKIVDRNKSDVLTLLNEARRIRKEGDPERAEAKYREIVEAFPDNPETWSNYGVFLRSSRKPQEACEAFTKAIKLRGGVHNYAELAITLLATGEDHAARENFYRFLEQATGPRQILTYTERFDARGQTEPAIAGYERLLDIYKGDKRAIEPLVQLGNVYLRLKDPEKALPFYQQAQELMPNELAITFNLARALQLSGATERARVNFEKAVQIYEQTQMVHPVPARRANAMEAMGIAYIAVGSTEKAKQNFISAIETAARISTSIFSALEYREIPPADFINEAKQLLVQAGGAVPSR